MKKVEDLLAKAARSRRLARDSTDYKLSALLNTMAEELEAKAAVALAEAKERLRRASTVEDEQA